MVDSADEAVRGCGYRPVDLGTTRIRRGWKLSETLTGNTCSESE